MAKREKIVEFRIRRFDPEKDRRYMSSFRVPVRVGMTLLDAFNHIKENLDGSFTFRHQCRMGQCGSCGVIVNGKPLLACYTQVLQLRADKLEIEPLPNMPVIKDLVVDVDPFFDTFGKIAPLLIKNAEEVNGDAEFVQSPEDLRLYWDKSICIKCGLCYAACPAEVDSNFLGPASLTTNYRFLVDTRDEGGSQRLKDASDTIWSCTSCTSCTLSCPKEIPCALSLDEERSMIVEDGLLVPRTVKDVLESASKYHNPLRMPPSKRMDWSKGLEIQELAKTEKTDVLCFIGCAAAYDVRNQEMAKAMAEIFGRLNVDFSVLGNAEWCCGDHILRLGEKGLFEELAEHNIELFRRHNFGKVVTLSPHCYYVFRNEEPYADVDINVMHYSEFLAETVEMGQLKLTKALKKKVTYHDPCFLGKRSGVYEAPRTILETIRGLELIELGRVKENSFCCGGGAGRIWTEEATPENRPCVDRVKEALELGGVEVIATACPFCVTTLEDAVKVLDVEDKIAVRDISELLMEVL